MTPFFAASMVRHAGGEPLSRRDDQGNEQVTTAGAEFMIGMFGPPLLLAGIITGLRARDSVDTQAKDSITTEIRPCRAVAVPNLAVALVADGQVVSERRTARDGAVVFELQRGELTKVPAALGLSVEGVAVTPSRDLAGLLRSAVERWQERARAPASTASVPTASPWATSAATQPIEEEGPRLFGLALASARRDEFEKAVLQTGCSVNWRENINIAHYDIACLKLPGFTTMKVLYDGQARLVRVKYTGNLNKEQRASRVQLLTEQYGRPGNQTATAVIWQLPSNFSIELSQASSTTELLYLNQRLDEELRRAVERNEQHKRDELKTKHGVAF
jgi:hypothetical protein